MKDRDSLMLLLQLLMKASGQESHAVVWIILSVCSDLPKALEMIQERLRKKEEVRVDSLCPPLAVVGMLRPALL